MYNVILFLSITALSAVVTSVTNSSAEDYALKFPYCNKEPLNNAIEPLPDSDLKRIDKLEQLHVFIRHGSRTTMHRIADIFPARDTSDLYFWCNYSVVHTRALNSEEYPYMSFSKQYVPNEEEIEGNCAAATSLPDLYMQHTANAKMIIEAFGTDIIGDNAFEVYSTDTERTQASAIAFMTSFLDMSDPSYVIPIWTHDANRDPYRPDSNLNCPNLSDWSEAKGKQSAEYKQLWNSEWAVTTRQQWLNETGAEFSSTQGITALPIVCFEMPIPIDHDVFEAAVNLSYARQSAVRHNNESSVAMAQLKSAPMVYLIRSLIDDYIKGESDRLSFVLHSFHDSTIFWLMESLEIFDGIQPIYAEMVTLELYSLSDDSGSYVFRWTRNGKPLLTYPGCDYSDGSQLCSVDTLLDGMDFAMPLTEWEPYCADITSAP